MQYQLLDQQSAMLSEGENGRSKVDNIRLRTLETDVIMLRQELAETNSQRTKFETETEKLKHSLKHIKEEAVKEYEKVIHNIKTCVEIRK